MRKNQITINVMELTDGIPLEYSVYCDSDNFCEALTGATQMVVEEHMKHQQIPSFGDKSLKRKTTVGMYKGTPIIQGDVLSAKADVIIHQVNCMGRMGSGIARQVRNKYPNVYDAYLEFCESHNKDELLGEVLCVDTEDGKTIANMFAQYDFGYDGKMYTHLKAFTTCLEFINTHFAGKRIAVPYKIGCGRGGANWDDVFPLITQKLSDCKIILYKYDE